MSLSQTTRLELDPVLRSLGIFNLVPKSVLEIGAANGYRLNALRERLRCEVTGIEPSAKAVEAGQSTFHGLNLQRGLAHELPFEDAQFDLVITHFVLHWIGRHQILRVVAEIDRVLENGGWLLIGDFAPPSPQKVSYHHLPDADVWTWKQNYAAMFLASQLYEVVGNLIFDHQTLEWSSNVSTDHRASVTILRKNCGGLYTEAKIG